MKRRRGLRGWCGLGLAVAALAGGTYSAKRYTEQHMLAAVLGSGVRAESVQWHWRQSAGCAEQVEIPLPYATDTHDQALQLYAPKLWFVYDQAALLRKRFILPRVVIDDALISTSDQLSTQQIVDIEFGPGVDLDGLVELPSDESVNFGQSTVKDSGLSTNATDLSLTYARKATGLSLPWLDDLQSLCDSEVNEKTIQGRQVSVDADMLSERVQGYYADNRSKAQKLLAEARDMQLQLVNMDNVLRQPELTEISRRLEQISDQLIKLKIEIGHSGKMLDPEHSRLRSALLVEKTELLRLADAFAAPAGDEIARAMITHIVKDQLIQPTRAVVMLADLMRKPFDASLTLRGQQFRYLDDQQPEFAASSARISGKAEIGDKAWPFKAEGNFEVKASALQLKSVEGNEKVSEPITSSGSSNWHMTIDAQPEAWQLDGQCPSIDGACTVTLTSSTALGLKIACVVERSKISGKGEIGLRQLVGSEESVERLTDAFAASYRSEALLRSLLDDAFVVDDQTPEMIRFDTNELEPVTIDELDNTAVSWLSTRMQKAATVSMADNYRQAAMQLEKLITGKLTDQLGLVATLRKDTEQFVVAQHEELRRIQASVNSLIEQRQANYYFARQPGGKPR